MTAAAMSERQASYRKEYQAQIHPLYSGLVHVGVMYAVGLAVIALMIIKFGSAGKGFEGRYTLRVRFPNASGVVLGMEVETLCW